MLKPLHTPLRTPLSALLLVVFVGQLVFDSPVLARDGCGAPPAPLERVDVSTDPHRLHHASHPVEPGPGGADRTADSDAHDHTATLSGGCDCGCISGLHCAPSVAAIASPAPGPFAFTGTSMTRLVGAQPTLQAHARRLDRPPA